MNDLVEANDLPSTESMPIPEKVNKIIKNLEALSTMVEEEEHDMGSQLFQQVMILIGLVLQTIGMINFLKEMSLSQIM